MVSRRCREHLLSQTSTLQSNVSTNAVRADDTTAFTFDSYLFTTSCHIHIHLHLHRHHYYHIYPTSPPSLFFLCLWFLSTFASLPQSLFIFFCISVFIMISLFSFPLLSSSTVKSFSMTLTLNPPPSLPPSLLSFLEFLLHLL